MATKEITAEKVIAGCKRAQPWNAFKLADKFEYIQVEYSEFRRAAIGEKKEAEINELLDFIEVMRLGPKYDREKTYAYFILSLSNLLYEG